MKFLIIFAVYLIAATLAAPQQSPYAFKQGTQIQLASRFLSEDDRDARVNGIDLASRFLDETTNEPIPVDARGDVQLIKQIENWPKEKQPFWYLNRKQIEAARSRPQVQPVVRTRSSFASVNGNDQLRT
ncbi:uncharacterized protein LOC123305738 [Chrysoperla carnea]|uniref:uncharacterized protein LOC123305738 n=1 Tax=Chrysoperla carnea TaxID=189513 RepID=UPI001D066D0B|nr:uncharacterized protein LOC123305738 [Chrysoperla carnea]